MEYNLLEHLGNKFGIIVTNDKEEIGRIHSNPKYNNWKYEYINGEYRFYSPRYFEKENLIFYHGGCEPDFDISKIDVLRSSQKQQKNTTDYAGFYMYDDENYESAIKYAIQENNIKNTNSKGVSKIIMSKDLKIFTVPNFSITRITKNQITELIKNGYDLIAGKMLGKIEYILLNKDKIIDMNFEKIYEYQDNFEEKSNFKK